MNRNRQKIVVSAYACEPDLGSEIGVGWHWVLEMSKYFDLWVVTRQSNRESIERWFNNNRTEYKPHFIYYDLPRKWRFWKRGLRGVRLYYILWQKFSNSLVKRCMQENGITIFHHLTYGNALWGVSSYGQQQDFIWGPTSAGLYIDREYTCHYTLKNRVKELLQRLFAKTLPFNIGFIKRCRKAKLILCKTEQTLNSIPLKYRGKAVLFTDVAMDNSIVTEHIKTKLEHNQPLSFLAVGRLEAWRGFDLLIEAFALAVKQNSSIRLDILGDGNDKKRLASLIAKLNLGSYISLIGNVTKQEYLNYMKNCNVVVNPTLKEGGVTTAFDSLSYRKPLICIDSGGYTRYFTDKYAFVIKLKSRNQTIQDLSKAIQKISCPTILNSMIEEIASIKNQFSWEQKGVQIYNILREKLEE